MDASKSLLTGPLPETLTKSELVGIGPNGQERIKIGDNLTLINGKLSATGGGGGGGDIYFHSIHIIGEGIGYICCNYYSNYPHHYTLKTFKDDIWAKNIACSGFVEVDGKQYAAMEIERTTEQDGLKI